MDFICSATGPRRVLTMQNRLSLSNHFVAGCLLTICVLFLSCSRNPADPPRGPATKSTGKEKNTVQADPDSIEPPADIVPGSTDRQFDFPLRDETVRLDPTFDGWETEAFNEAASQQLKLLAKKLTRPNALQPQQLAELISENFHCHPIRPELIEAYRDQALVVLRPDKKGVVTSDIFVNFKKPAGLVKAFQSLLSSHPAAEGIRVAFKVFTVERKETTGRGIVTTHVDFQASSRTDDRAVQQNATWLCDWETDAGKNPLLSRIVVEKFEEVVSQGNASSWFADCTGAMLDHDSIAREQFVYGVDHWRERVEKTLAPAQYGLEGVTVGDVNGDGLDDIYICHGNSLPNRLMVQQVDGTLVDVSTEAGVDWLDPCSSALLIDLDNDGDQDLVVGTHGALLVHENNGDGHFDVRAHLQFSTDVLSMAAADYDGDSRLDIYVCAHTRETPDQQESILGIPIPIYDANNGAPNMLVKNLGDWKFSDVTGECGIDQNNTRFSFAAAWEDYDNDGDMDLYVANDFGRNNLYRNEDGQFTDVADQSGVEDIASGMSVSWGDYDRDGWMDLYVSNMFSSAGNRVAYQRQFRTGEDPAVLGQLRRFARGNTLFRNIGNGRFQDVSTSMDVTMGRWAWGSNFADLNNDGRQDLVVANGWVTSRTADDL